MPWNCSRVVDAVGPAELRPERTVKNKPRPTRNFSVRRVTVSSRPSLFELGGVEFFDRFLELLAGAELHDRPLRNDHFVFRLVGVAPLAALADLDLEYAEVAQFDGVAGDQVFGDVVCLLYTSDAADE